jgi:hypothetical protein
MRWPGSVAGSCRLRASAALRTCLFPCPKPFPSPFKACSAGRPLGAGRRASSRRAPLGTGFAAWPTRLSEPGLSPFRPGSVRGGASGWTCSRWPQSAPEFRGAVRARVFCPDFVAVATARDRRAVYPESVRT